MSAGLMPRTYPCAHCDAVFSNPMQLGGHVHAAHPDHRRGLPKFLRGPARPLRDRPSLKRVTDVWPGRP